MAVTKPDDTGLKELKNALKTGEFARLYFFCGEERYLQEYYLSALKKKVVTGPMEEFNYRRLTAEAMSVEALQEAVEAMPMMAEMTLVQVDEYDLFAQNQDTREKLAAILNDIPDTCCLVFYYDTVPFAPNKDYADLMDAVKKNGVVVEFAKQTNAALAEWIARHFRKCEKTISGDLCQYLIFLTGGSMTTLHTEIEKVASYSRMPAVTRQDIDAVVEPVLQAVMFDITDALADGDYDKALAKLHHVLQTGEDPIKVLATIGGHFRRLLMAHTVAEAGRGSDALMPLLRTKSDYYARKVTTQARRLSVDMCCTAVELCYETDRKIKRSYDNVTRLLELLLLTLAQEARK